MDTHQAILTKLDVRQFNPKKAPADLKLKVLEAARAAQTGNNKQHLRFILVQNKESIKKEEEHRKRDLLDSAAANCIPFRL